MIEPSRFRAGIYGLLLGDAAGVPYEFNPPEALRPFADRIDMTPPSGFRRTYSVPPGTWSDDGALALCLLESLVDRGEFDAVDQARKLVAWLDRGHLAVDNHVFDVGGTTREAIGRIREAIATQQLRKPVALGARHEQSAGNGSLMRILPLALWHDGPDSKLARLAAEQSAITHAHPACLACCAVYCLWARKLMASEPDPFEAALAKVAVIAVGNPMAGGLAAIEAWRSKPPTGTGYVVDTLFSARHALEAGGDFKDVVRRSILLGHDTDTTAAVAGGLAGLKFGEAGLPADWMGLLRGQGEVDAILARR